jgi:triacylglycerol lipase
VTRLFQRLTGHSLGAAVSLILQGYLDADGFRVERSFNFGQPKITDEDGVKRLRHLRVLRVLNDEEPGPLPAPHPPKAPRDVYRHVGPEAVLETPPTFLFFDRHNTERLAVTGFWDHLGLEAPSAHRCAA